MTSHSLRLILSFLSVLSAMAKRESCGSVFETQVGEYKADLTLHVLFSSSLSAVCTRKYCTREMNIWNFSSVLSSDHTLLGYLIGKAVVDDEFECQLNDVSRITVASPLMFILVGNNSMRVCELNSKTRQMKSDDFNTRFTPRFVNVSGFINFRVVGYVGVYTVRVGRGRLRQSEVFFPLADHVVANHVVPPGIWQGLIQNRPGFRSCHRHLR